MRTINHANSDARVLPGHEDQLNSLSESLPHAPPPPGPGCAVRSRPDDRPRTRPRLSAKAATPAQFRHGRLAASSPQRV